MAKRPPSKPKETQHEKFVKLARESGADESEGAFVEKLQKLADKSRDQKPKRKKRG